MSLFTFDFLNRVFDKKQTKNKVDKRKLNMEPLEDRALLSVTPADFTQLTASQDYFGPASFGENVAFNTENIDLSALAATSGTAAEGPLLRLTAADVTCVGVYAYGETVINLTVHNLGDADFDGEVDIKLGVKLYSSPSLSGAPIITLDETFSMAIEAGGEYSDVIRVTLPEDYQGMVSMYYALGIELTIDPSDKLGMKSAIVNSDPLVCGASILPDLPSMPAFTQDSDGIVSNLSVVFDKENTQPPVPGGLDGVTLENFNNNVTLTRNGEVVEGFQFTSLVSDEHEETYLYYHNLTWDPSFVSAPGEYALTIDGKDFIWTASGTRPNWTGKPTPSNVKTWKWTVDGPSVTDVAVSSLSKDADANTATLTFDVAGDYASIIADALSVTKDGEAFAATFDVTGSGDTYTVDWGTQLDAPGDYIVSIDGSLLVLEGYAFTGAFSTEEWTVADTSVAALTDVTLGADNASATFTFDKVVSWTAGGFSIVGMDGVTFGTPTSEDGLNWTVTWDAITAPGTYAVAVDGTAFTTVASGLAAAGTLTSEEWTVADTSVAALTGTVALGADNASATFTFDKAVSYNAGGFAIVGMDGVTFGTPTSEDGLTWTVTWDAITAPGTYSFTVDGTAFTTVASGLAAAGTLTSEEWTVAPIVYPEFVKVEYAQPEAWDIVQRFTITFDSAVTYDSAARDFIFKKNDAVYNNANYTVKAGTKENTLIVTLMTDAYDSNPAANYSLEFNGAAFKNAEGHAIEDSITANWTVVTYAGPSITGVAANFEDLEDGAQGKIVVDFNTAVSEIYGWQNKFVVYNAAGDVVSGVTFFDGFTTGEAQFTASFSGLAAGTYTVQVLAGAFQDVKVGYEDLKTGDSPISESFRIYDTAVASLDSTTLGADNASATLVFSQEVSYKGEGGFSLTGYTGDFTVTTEDNLTFLVTWDAQTAVGEYTFTVDAAAFTTESSNLDASGTGTANWEVEAVPELISIRKASVQAPWQGVKTVILDFDAAVLYSGGGLTLMRNGVEVDSSEVTFTVTPADWMGNKQYNIVISGTLYDVNPSGTDTYELFVSADAFATAKGTAATGDTSITWDVVDGEAATISNLVVDAKTSTATFSFDKAVSYVSGGISINDYDGDFTVNSEDGINWTVTWARITTPGNYTFSVDPVVFTTDINGLAAEGGVLSYNFEVSAAANLSTVTVDGDAFTATVTFDNEVTYNGTGGFSIEGYAGAFNVSTDDNLTFTVTFDDLAPGNYTLVVDAAAFTTVDNELAAEGTLSEAFVVNDYVAANLTGVTVDAENNQATITFDKAVTYGENGGFSINGYAGDFYIDVLSGTTFVVSWDAITEYGEYTFTVDAAAFTSNDVVNEPAAVGTMSDSWELARPEVIASGSLAEYRLNYSSGYYTCDAFDSNMSAFTITFDTEIVYDAEAFKAALYIWTAEGYLYDADVNFQVTQVDAFTFTVTWSNDVAQLAPELARDGWVNFAIGLDLRGLEGLDGQAVVAADGSDRIEAGWHVEGRKADLKINSFYAVALYIYGDNEFTISITNNGPHPTPEKWTIGASIDIEILFLGFIPTWQNDLVKTDFDVKYVINPGVTYSETVIFDLGDDVRNDPTYSGLLPTARTIRVKGTLDPKGTFDPNMSNNTLQSNDIKVSSSWKTTSITYGATSLDPIKGVTLTSDQNITRGVAWNGSAYNSNGWNLANVSQYLHFYKIVDGEKIEIPDVMLTGTLPSSGTWTTATLTWNDARLSAPGEYYMELDGKVFQSGKSSTSSNKLPMNNASFSWTVDVVDLEVTEVTTSVDTIYPAVDWSFDVDYVVANNSAVASKANWGATVDMYVDGVLIASQLVNNGSVAAGATINGTTRFTVDADMAAAILGGNEVYFVVTADGVLSNETKADVDIYGDLLANNTFTTGMLPIGTLPVFTGFTAKEDRTGELWFFDPITSAKFTVDRDITNSGDDILAGLTLYCNGNVVENFASFVTAEVTGNTVVLTWAEDVVTAAGNYELVINGDYVLTANNVSVFNEAKATWSISDSVIVTTLTDGINPNDEFVSLREALVYAKYLGYDKITFMDGLTGTMDVTAGTFNISSDIQIVGNGLVTINGNDGRIFDVRGTAKAPVNVTIAGLTLQNGFATNGGAILSTYSNLTLKDLTISDSMASRGAALYQDRGTLKMDGVTIADNFATDSGAVYLNYVTDAKLANISILNNEASQNGAGIASTYSVLEISGTSKIDGNVVLGTMSAENFTAAKYLGGGIYVNGGLLNLGGNTVVSNNQACRGAGVYASNAEVTVGGFVIIGEVYGAEGEVIGGGANIAGFGAGFFAANCASVNFSAAVNGNIAYVQGAGMYLRASETVLSSALVSGNSFVDKYTEEGMAVDTRGGGIYQDGGSLTINGGMIRDNNAGRGGAIFQNGGTLITSSAAGFSSNSANISGGALFLNNALGTKIAGATWFNGNTAVSNGGAIFNQNALSSGGGLLLDTAQFAYNTSGANGGAVYLASGNLGMKGILVTANSAKAGAGLYIAKGKAGILGSSTFTNNTATTAKGKDITVQSGTAKMQIGKTTTFDGLNAAITLFESAINPGTGTAQTTVVADDDAALLAFLDELNGLF